MGKNFLRATIGIGAVGLFFGLDVSRTQFGQTLIWRLAASPATTRQRVRGEAMKLGIFILSALAFVVCEAPSAGHAAPALQTLYSFGGGNDGAFPESALIADQIDTLYGTTFAGGSVDEGTIFKLTPPATPGSLGPKACFPASANRALCP